jgi:hypothetical protein
MKRDFFGFSAGQKQGVNVDYLRSIWIKDHSMKKKSRGQQLWEIATEELQPGDEVWDEADPQLKKAYNRIAKRLYRSWTCKGARASYKRETEILMEDIPIYYSD